MDSLMRHLKQEQNYKQDLGFRSNSTTAGLTINRIVAPVSPPETSLQRKRRPNEIERLQTTLQRPLNSVEIDKLYKGYRNLEKCTKRRNCDCYHCQLLKSALTDESSVSNDSSSDSDNEVISTIFCECFNKKPNNSTVFKNKVFGATQEFDNKRISDGLLNNTPCIPIYYKRNSADAKKTRNCWEKLFNTVTSSFRLIWTLSIGVILAGVKLLCHVFTFLSAMSKRRRRFRKTYPDPEGKLESIERKLNEDVLSEVTVHQTP